MGGGCLPKFLGAPKGLARDECVQVRAALDNQELNSGFLVPRLLWGPEEFSDG